MDEYIKRKDAISAICFGCNQEFSDEPCEPKECYIRQAISNTPTADVVPKSEVKALKNQVNRLQKYAAKRDEKLNALLVAKTKQEVARKIFEEIENNVLMIISDETFAELKNKYTESESVLGEYKFDEKIHTGPLDLSDAKFIDEDGNVTTPADWQDWNETPPWEESEGNI